MIRYILIATDRSTRQTMYWGDAGEGGTCEWRYNRGHAKRMNRKVATMWAAKLNETDTTVQDVAVVAE